MLVQDAVAVKPQQSCMTDDSTSLSQVQSAVPASTTSSGPLMVHGLPSPGVSSADYSQHPSPSSQNQQPDAPDTKEGIEELCPVCGDKVSGYHYGLLTCESCKGFFKRTVQNKKVYTCVADRGCHIDKSQRKRCPYCRFQKCLDVGMKLEAVRADRMRGGRNKFGPMYKRDRARRLQMMRQKQIARNQCPSVGGATSGSPDGVCILSSPPFPPTSGGGQPPFFVDSPGVKQELIQIPQLSSSTSSPDSSPSPLAVAAGAAGLNPFGPSQINQPQQMAIQQSGPSQGTIQASEKGVWVSNPPCSPSPPLVVGHHPGSPPKSYQQQQHPQQQQGQGSGDVSPNLLPSSAASGQSNGVVVPLPGAPKMPGLIREFQLCMPDDKEWHTQLFSLLQDQTYNQCEVDLFELMCKVIDQALFGQVDWARNSIFFKELKVDDQMKLLQHSWSDMLILDHLHQRLHHGLPDETTLPNGQKFDLLALALLGLPSMAEHLHRVAARFQEIKWDPLDYICLKFLLLLNPEVRGLSNLKLVNEAHDQAQQTLLEYCLNCYPQITDKFSLILQQLPEIHLMGMRGEEFLYFRHLSGSASSQTLLMEMLHAKKK